MQSLNSWIKSEEFHARNIIITYYHPHTWIPICTLSLIELKRLFSSQRSGGRVDVPSVLVLVSSVPLPLPRILTHHAHRTKQGTTRTLVCTYIRTYIHYLWRNDNLVIHWLPSFIAFALPFTLPPSIPHSSSLSSCPSGVRHAQRLRSNVRCSPLHVLLP